MRCQSLYHNMIGIGFEASKLRVGNILETDLGIILYCMMCSGVLFIFLLIFLLHSNMCVKIMVENVCKHIGENHCKE